jgi:hypothetical protein
MNAQCGLHSAMDMDFVLHLVQGLSDRLESHGSESASISRVQPFCNELERSRRSSK